MEDSGAQANWGEYAYSLTKALLRKGLSPRSISRDLSWGTPVPGDSGKVLYVWFDAPIGYISVTAGSLEHWEEWWKSPESVELVQFMGKDNIFFHTVMFPCSLLGTNEDYTLVSRISACHHLIDSSGKFSKSANTGVFADEVIKSDIQLESIRFYLLYNRPETTDAVFDWDSFRNVTNRVLLGNLGNFCHRTLALAYRTGDAQTDLGPDDEPVLREIRALVLKYTQQMEALKLRAALHTVLELSSLGNKYLQAAQPWKVSSPSLAIPSTLLHTLLALVSPFIPSFSEKILSQLSSPPPLHYPVHSVQPPPPLRLPSSPVPVIRKLR